MDVNEARELLGRALFVDVREPYEFEAGHIEDSLHIPIGEVAERWEEFRSDDPVVVVCHVGQRSALVVDFLEKRGVAANNLEGGLAAWARAGLPLTADASPG
ncbi:MAG: rhodanese-like domain-containing protein [Actinomycetota bacterium]|nr:rhodanese-like domain-containing protein [Actinomycetota bacterium]